MLSPDTVAFWAVYGAVVGTVAFVLALVAVTRSPSVNVNQNVTTEEWQDCATEDEEDEDDDDGDSWKRRGKCVDS